jgi:hypothetical protein
VVSLGVVPLISEVHGVVLPVSFSCIRNRKSPRSNGGEMDGGQAPSAVHGRKLKGAGAGDFATHVNIKALHYLIALAECLNFSRAADRCAVTQPTLSIQVRKLEEYLGVTLFERNRARVLLTAEGEKVLRLARVIVGAADEILGIRRSAARRKRPLRETHAAADRVGAALIEEINYRAHTDR